MIYRIRCWLICWLAGRYGFVINVNVNGNIEVPVTCSNVKLHNATLKAIARATRRAARGTGDAL